MLIARVDQIRILFLGHPVDGLTMCFRLDARSCFGNINWGLSYRMVLNERAADVELDMFACGIA